MRTTKKGFVKGNWMPVFLLAAAMIFVAQCAPGPDSGSAGPGTDVIDQAFIKHQKVSPSERKAAVESLLANGFQPGVAAAPLVDPGTGLLIPDYFGSPNWAISPSLTKFVDKLPGLGPASANALGQYIPVAVGDTTSFPGSDYYEIAVVEYKEQLHSELTNKTLLRGYVQLSTANVPGAHIALRNPDGHAIKLPDGSQAYGVDNPHYLGPVIVAKGAYPGGTGRPVRVKFYNLLPTGMDGNLFIPRDMSVMGSGMFEIDDPMNPGSTIMGNFTDNRATLHLHGNNTVWISDGTPHQWITPKGETTDYPQGVSVRPVPDMPDTGNPTDGTMTFYWSNALSARLMFYHDHAYGITRLNVYIGEAAGYVITDEVEQDLINGTNISGVNPGLLKVLPDIGIPLVIQDRTFVDAATIGTLDPTWLDINQETFGSTPGFANTGDLWYPHVYMAAQNPWDISGMNPFGRWMYGPWFYPVTTMLDFPPVPNPYCLPTPPPPGSYPDGDYDCSATPWEPPYMPATPNPSMPGEGFMDTQMVNGTVYPYWEVEPRAYRFRILNAGNDRSLNLQLYVAADQNSPTALSAPIRPSKLNANKLKGKSLRLHWKDNATNETGFHIEWATDKQFTKNLGSFDVGPNITKYQVTKLAPNKQYFFRVRSFNDTSYSGWDNLLSVKAAPRSASSISNTATAPLKPILCDGVNAVPVGRCTEVAMVPVSGMTLPPFDFSGVPDPDTAGPDWIQIGTEGGFLPAPVVIPSQPIGWNLNPTAFNFGNVDQHSLALGTAERADVIVDFSQYAGKTLILYNDAPAAWPAPVPNNDYYTGSEDQTATGGAPTVLPGKGPNTRTIMQIRVGTAVTTPKPDVTLANLQTVWAKGPAAKRGVFERSQDPIIIPQQAYNSAYNNTFPTSIAEQFVFVNTAKKKFKPIDANGALQTPVTLPIEPKGVHDEMGGVYDTVYGRMSGMLGLTIPPGNSQIGSFLPYGFASPPVDIIQGSVFGTLVGSLADGTQIWNISQNGVDTHTIHVHLFNAQLINRVGWDGAMIPPDPNELGWKETFRVNPLEQTIIALRPSQPTIAQFPFLNQIPNSVRLIDPTIPAGAPLMAPPPAGWFDPAGNAITEILNHEVNFGWEYVYHCHILAHEEMDMMHATAFALPPETPLSLILTPTGTGVDLTWTPGSANATSFTIQRSTDNFVANIQTLGSVAGDVTLYSDPIGGSPPRYYYRVFASNTVGDASMTNFPFINQDSGFSNVVATP